MQLSLKRIIRHVCILLKYHIWQEDHDLAEMLIKEKAESNEIKLLKVASADNTSDLGTKRLALPLFNKLTSRIIDKSLKINL